VRLNKKFITSLITIFLCFFLDRVSKFLVIDFFLQNNLQNLYVNTYLNIALIWNKGIAFGFLESSGGFYHLISIIIITFILFLIYSIYKSNIKSEIFSYSLILGGAFGNLIDRLYYQAVPDFLDVHFNQFHWFTFNIADICITIGIVLLIIFDFLVLNISKNKNE